MRWTSFVGTLLMLMGACGRSPLDREPPLLVQVIDRTGEPVPHTAVVVSEDDLQLTVTDRTDEYGITSLPFPGAGEYRFQVRAVFRYQGGCPMTGATEVVLVNASEVVVVEVEVIAC